MKNISREYRGAKPKTETKGGGDICSVATSEKIRGVKRIFNTHPTLLETSVLPYRPHPPTYLTVATQASTSFQHQPHQSYRVDSVKRRTSSPAFLAPEAILTATSRSNLHGPRSYRNHPSHGPAPILPAEQKSAWRNSALTSIFTLIAILSSIFLLLRRIQHLFVHLHLLLFTYLDRIQDGQTLTKRSVLRYRIRPNNFYLWTLTFNIFIPVILLQRTFLFLYLLHLVIRRWLQLSKTTYLSTWISSLLPSPVCLRLTSRLL